MRRSSQRPTDRRRHTRETERNLILGGFGLALVIGGLLVRLFWGSGAAIMALICMGGILILFALLWGILALMEWIARSE